MNIKQLLEERAALLQEAAKPETTAERLAEIRARVEAINYTVTELRRDEADAKAEEEKRAARPANGGAPAPAPVVVHDEAPT